MENIKNKMSCSGNDCFDDDFFNKNLKNGIITHLVYSNLSVEQNPNIVYPFSNLISTIRPNRVIEIGTFAGGLTLIIRDILDNNGLYESEITTYDVNEATYLKEQMGSKKIIAKTKNLFSHSYSTFNDEDSKNEIVNLIQQDGLTLVLCDGGVKKNEFNLISPYLKIGDVIMAHDYAANLEEFENNIKGKVWNWMEIQDSDIDDCCSTFNLIPLNQEEFTKVAWVCKIKN